MAGETVDVPVVGKVKPAYVYAGLAAVGGVVIYAYWSRRKSDQAASAPDYYADLRTGSETPNDDFVNPAPNNSGNPGSEGTGAPRTDEEWARRTVERLSWYEQGYVSQVTGKYLARQPVTPDEATLIREAWAQVGRPPGNQPIIPVTGAPGPTPPTPPTPPVPSAPLKIVAVRTTRTSVFLTWDPVPGATSYVVSQGPAPYKKFNAGARTGMDWLHLKPGSVYTFSVEAFTTTGSKRSNVVTAHTQK